MSAARFSGGGRCEAVVREFRSASCRSNKLPLLDELKDKLECDTFNGAVRQQNGALLLPLISAVLLGRTLLW